MFINNTNRIDPHIVNPLNKNTREVKSEFDKDRDADGVYIPVRRKKDEKQEHKEKEHSQETNSIEKNTSEKKSNVDLIA